MKIEKIDHVNVIVKDLGAAVKRFSDIMGTRFVGPFKGVSPILAAFDTLGLQLQQPLPSSQSYIGDLLNRYGEGAHYISVKVENIEEAIAELKAKDVNFLFIGRKELIKFAVTDPEDSYGVGFRLLEYQHMQEAPYVVSGKVAELPWM